LSSLAYHYDAALMDRSLVSIGKVSIK